MAVNRAPKQWSFIKTETKNLQYTLSLDPHFSLFITPSSTWRPHTRAAPLRDFDDDGNELPRDRRRTAQQKLGALELMLGQIANYCPVISRNTIIKTSISLPHIWQLIRLHYGFQSTGAHFIDLASISLEPNERPEDLYQRLIAFIDDNLLRRNGGITHHGEELTEDEELSPSLENMTVLTWLSLIHKDLPRLVKQRYGTELHARSHFGTTSKPL